MPTQRSEHPSVKTKKCPSETSLTGIFYLKKDTLRSSHLVQQTDVRKHSRSESWKFVVRNTVFSTRFFHDFGDVRVVNVAHFRK